MCQMCGPVCGKDVYYSLDNLRHYLISQGENYDSVIEKFALHISNYKSKTEILEMQVATLNTTVAALELRIKALEDA